VQIDDARTRYLLRSDNPNATLELVHHGRPLTLRPDQPVTEPVPPLPSVGDPPQQPAGRAPRAERRS
jgi:alpha,alpha-trehalose phosphorylase